MINPFTSYKSSAKQYHRSYLTHSSILNSKSIIDVEINKPSKLIDNSYQLRKYSQSSYNPFNRQFLIPSQKVQVKNTNKIDLINNNPFLNRTPFAYHQQKKQQERLILEQSLYHTKRSSFSSQLQLYDTNYQKQQKKNNRYVEQDDDYRVPQFNYNYQRQENKSNNYQKNHYSQEYNKQIKPYPTYLQYQQRTRRNTYIQQLQQDNTKQKTSFGKTNIQSQQKINDKSIIRMINQLDQSQRTNNNTGPKFKITSSQVRLVQQRQFITHQPINKQQYISQKYKQPIVKKQQTFKPKSVKKFKQQYLMNNIDPYNTDTFPKNIEFQGKSFSLIKIY